MPDEVELMTSSAREAQHENNRQYRSGDRQWRLASWRGHAAALLPQWAEAQEIVDHQVEVVQTQWQDAANLARLSTRERDALWETSILNPAIFWEK